MWLRNPLRGKALEVLDCMKGGTMKELAYDIQPFMVGNMGGRLLPKRLPVEILPKVSQVFY